MIHVRCGPGGRASMAGMNRLVASLALAAVLASAPALAADAAPESRGALLYGNHCITCHNANMHWRANSIVKNWGGLVTLVRRWQGTAQLNWTDEDIDEVAAYLNQRFYHLERPGKAISLATPGGAQPQP